MTNKLLRSLKDKTEQVDRTLVEFWESLTPNLKQKRHFYERFLSIQKRTKKLTNYITEETKNA